MSEGVESEEVSRLLSEEVEVLEQPSEGVLGERLEWKERVVVLGPAGRGFEVSLELRGGQSPKNAKGV